MGLETHVDRVLKKAGVEQAYLYSWSNGLRLESPTPMQREHAAERIMKILDKSGEFGPTRYNRKTDKIEFGVFSNFFSETFVEYNQYCEDFKNWIIDREGKKMEV